MLYLLRNNTEEEQHQGRTCVTVIELILIQVCVCTSDHLHLLQYVRSEKE